MTTQEEGKWHSDGEAVVEDHRGILVLDQKTTMVAAVNRAVGEVFLRRRLIVVVIYNSRTGTLESGRIHTGESPRR